MSIDWNQFTQVPQNLRKIVLGSVLPRGFAAAVGVPVEIHPSSVSPGSQKAATIDGSEARAPDNIFAPKPIA